MPPLWVTSGNPTVLGRGVRENHNLFVTALLTARKPGNAAITPPKPYSDAVFIAANNAPPTAALVPSANAARTRPNAVTTTNTMPSSSAPSTAQMPITPLMGRLMALCRPGKASAVSA